MIAWLQGIIIEKQPPVIVLNVNGVGYELETPVSTFYDLPHEGEQVTLHTHMVVREDAQLLYAFTTVKQRNMFRSLLKVNGIGPKVALAILSTLSAQEFLNCIMQEDITQLSNVPGIGKKTAQRLVVEMKDRLEKESTDMGITPSSAATGKPDPAQDAIGALVSLGYKPFDAARVVRAIATDDLSSEEMIRQALRSLSGNVL